jgi:hypothetical protein
VGGVSRQRVAAGWARWRPPNSGVEPAFQVAVSVLRDLSSVGRAATADYRVDVVSRYGDGFGGFNAGIDQLGATGRPDPHTFLERNRERFGPATQGGAGDGPNTSYTVRRPKRFWLDAYWS